MNPEHLQRLYNEGLLSHLDIHFAHFLTGASGDITPGVFLAAALASGYTRQGHICLDLSTMEGKRLLEVDASTWCPELNDWLDTLKKSAVVGEPGEYKPLILDERGRLYLYRYWDYQEKLAAGIKRRLRGGDDRIDCMGLKDKMARLFPSGGPPDVDWQKVAAFTAATKRFCLISGGPGTGKTTVIARILALLLALACPNRIRFALVAPTGKAAARLQQAVEYVAGTPDYADPCTEGMPLETSTIHRLLGSLPHSPYFRHNEKNPLPVDAVVIDEASMVDLALMSKLVQALPPQARLILVGDKDQLASVEAGAVFGDICNTGIIHGFSNRFCESLRAVTGYTVAPLAGAEPESGLQDCIVHLEKNYRFGAESGIGALSLAVRKGDAPGAMEVLRSGVCRDVTWRDVSLPEDRYGAMRAAVLAGFGDYLRLSEPQEIIHRFDRFRILCVVREGPFGVVALNRLVERILEEGGIIRGDQRWYKGRPVLITSNDYQLRLFNGDVGIVLPDPATGNELRAFFPGVDGRCRTFHPLRLPDHETVYAMTVHKSQGSEFDEVLFILPDRQSPILSREVIYTGVTRARKRIDIWGEESAVRDGVTRRVERSSGLREMLWGK
ncbi:MAG: exodeoxyribonuclease V subunit alpha [Deltaproteobacteria bacterium]|nr:exodeoxyribonuclease V subunit alpha [Deltaproteobacteria bacterium]